MLELYDMPTELAGFVGQGALSDAESEPEARIEQLMNVTEARVRDAAQRIFRAHSSSLVVVGKLGKSAQNELKAAQLALGT